MLSHCQSRAGFLLLGMAILFTLVAFITLLDSSTTDTNAFFGLCMFAFLVGFPGLFLCIRAAPPSSTPVPGLRGWLRKTLTEMACCNSILAAALNAFALTLLGITLLMLIDGWVNNDANAQGGAVGALIMTGLVGLLGRVTCKPRTEVPPQPHAFTPKHPVARNLGNIKVVRLACPSCNAAIPAELLSAGKSHLTCPYCGSDVVVQESGKTKEN